MTRVALIALAVSALASLVLRLADRVLGRGQGRE